jgi:hypothetical protein
MKQFTTTFIIIVLLGIAGYFTYNYFMDWHLEEVDTARQQMREEITLRESPPVPKEKLIEAFGGEPSEVSHEDSFEVLERQVMAFFSYLDMKDYIKSFKLEKGTYHEYLQIVEKLSSNIPVVTGETESLYTLIKNMSHIYRVLGGKRINLIKDILKNESDIIESVTKTFYLWFTKNNDISKKTKERPSLKVLYEYSTYFLNTLSGRHYILRRVPKIRVLSTYYCVLILDKANDAELNSNGADIRPHIKSLLNDIRNQTGFVNKGQYLSELEKLDEKYQL